MSHIWGITNILWKDANWTWGERQLVSQIVANPPGVDATTLIHPWLEELWNPYRSEERDKKKRRKLIKLVCKVRGIEYDAQKEIKDFKITIDDVKLVVKAVANIDLKIKK